MKILKMWMPVVLMVGIVSCCSSKKQKSPAAMDALPNRNIQDPRLENRPAKAELMDSSVAAPAKRSK